MLPIINEVPEFKSVQDLKERLQNFGCRRCDLGFQKEINGCCVARGTPLQKRMIIGEAPGKEEDSRRQPFTGPAGKLMDQIFQSVGLSTDAFYVTNIVKCRPYLPRGAGKENFTPKIEQQKKCNDYLNQEIRLIKPKLVVTIGGIATAAVLNIENRFRMKDYRGRVISAVVGGWAEWETKVFPMYHPAAILHASYDPELQYQLKLDTWNDIQKLKKLMEKENL